MKCCAVIIGCLAVSLAPMISRAKTVRYDLKVTQQAMNMSGRASVPFALAVNGGIPSPTLEFTEGDEAEIHVTNGLDKGEVSIHWHGLLLPPEEDGVAYVNTPPIHAGETRVFRFKLRQNGTYWYHSHTGLQEQKGVFGAFVIHPKRQIHPVDRDVVAVLSDWSDEDADQIMSNLRKDGDYYQYKKNTIRSWTGALRAGALGTFLANEWTRMGGMDLSDVGYDAFLINGKRDSQLVDIRPGQKVRVRLINAGSSSYFHVSLGKGQFKVVAADGQDVAPMMSKEILMGMAETYDIIFEPGDRKNYELRATVQDGTGHASAWIGSGEKVSVPDRPLPHLYASMDHGGGHAGHSAHSGHAGHAQTAPDPAPAAASEHSAHHGHGMHSASKESTMAADSVTVDVLKAAQKTAFPRPLKGKIHEVKLVLGGDMRRYIWHINGKAITQDRTLTINEGDIVRYTFVNETMMHHPMHLHGHFFRVLNDQKEFSPLKHTVDVPPHGSRTIEFMANEPGDWMLHCHNLYHMHTGMARVVQYSTFKPRDEIQELQKRDPHLHDHIYYTGLVEAASNHTQARLRLSKTWDTLEGRIEFREEDHGVWGTESDLLYRRWMGNFLNLAAGGTSFEGRQHAVAGLGYLLPMLIESTLLVNHEGHFRLEIEKRFQWTSQLYTLVDFLFVQNHKTEFEISLMYAPNWAWSGGLMLTENRVGGGIEYRF